MKESIKGRIDIVRDTEDFDILRKHLCPFYEKGGHPDCLTCRKTEAIIEECRDYYLERISTFPMDIWSEEFDKFIAKERETVSAEDISGIGINCDSCYMSDKCPMFKKGYACGIAWNNNQPQTPTEFMDFLIKAQFERVSRATVYEKIDGGVPDAGLSGEMDRLQGMLVTKSNLGRDKVSVSIEASGEAAGAGGGILAKLFGGKTEDKE